MSDSLAQAHEDLYSALNVMLTGEADPILAVWSSAEDVTYGGPFGGFVSGRAAIVDAFNASAAMNLQGAIEVSDVHIVDGGNIGYTVCIEHGLNHVIDGENVNLEHRATNIFRKESDGWHLVHHHTDRSH